jgi:hypothetical protein
MKGGIPMDSIPEGNGILQQIRQRGGNGGSQDNLFKAEAVQVRNLMGLYGADPGWCRSSYLWLAETRVSLHQWLEISLLQLQVRTNLFGEKDIQVMKILIHSWLKTGGRPREFVGDLQKTNYRLDRSWEQVNLPGVLF